MKKEKKVMSVFGHYRKAIGKKMFYALMANGLLFGMGALITMVIIPNYYKNIIDAVTSGASFDTIVYIIGTIFIAACIQTLFDRLYEHYDARNISKIFNYNAAYALEHTTTHSYQFFANNFTGSLITKIKRFVTSIDQLYGIMVRDFLLAGISVIGVLVVLFINNILLGAIALLWFTIFFSVMVSFTKIRIPLEQEKSKMESKVTGVISDIITNIINLKLFSSKKREQKDFDLLLKEDDRIRMKTWRMANRAYTWQSIITLCAQVSLIYTSVWLWSKGLITPGTIVLTISYGQILFNRLGFLGSSIRRFTDAYTNAKEFTDLLNEQVEITDPTKPEVLAVTEGNVKFNDVSFAYKNGRPIFENFDLEIKSGEKVGIIGTSGAGKTTVTKLILRFADVTGGSITIDGQDIRNITQDDLRSVVSYVPQDPILFHRSLRENIAYGRPDATEEEIIEASKEAHCHEFISGLEHGYDTLVGERGIKLSGGERQRVAIARAILKNAPVLILDEATSSLDSVSETHIKEALDRLMQGKTTIVIAHRLSTIEKMDRIIVLEKGEIVEEGSHRELLAKKGTYFNFWNHQNGGFIE
jgi:ATP-binding cassette subfamily B protein